MVQTNGNEHRPVLLAEVIAALRIVPDGFYLDGTYGRGGHSGAILDRLGPHGRLLAFDKDPEACAHARMRFGADPRFEICHGSFTRAAQLSEAGMTAPLAGACFDLGVSSPQLDDAHRGFSFMHDGPLDMRMDTTAEVDAAAWLNAATADEIERVLREYGEERRAAKIANAISSGPPLRTTRELASLVASVSGCRPHGRDPATRTFLAIRLYLNRELETLREALAAAVASLCRGGRLAVISFHSLEDRIVKRCIREHSTPRYSQITGQPLPGTEAVLRRVGKPVRAGADEAAANPRARSALLRVAEKL